MAAPKVTLESVQALARLIGLELPDEKVQGLLPQLKRGSEGVAGLDELKLEGVEPAVSFRADAS